VRILTWNCGMALARKAPNLLALNPDIAVVQECSKKSVDALHGHGLSGLWLAPIQTRGWQSFAAGSSRSEQWTSSSANGWFPFGFMAQ